MSHREQGKWVKGWNALSIEELVEAVQGIRKESDLEDAMKRGLNSRVHELKRSIARQSGSQTEENENAILTIEEHIESLIGGKK